MHKYKNILWDLDGTLLDTNIGVIKAVRKTIEMLHYDMPNDEKLKKFVGPPMQESFEKYFGLSQEEALKNANIFREFYKDYLYEAKHYNGVLESLQRLKERNFKIAIATNKSHENAINILEKFGILKFCDFAKGSDLKGELTKTDIVKECLNYLNAKQEESVLIGDSIADAKGAKENNIDFIAVLYGFGFKSAEDLKDIQHIANFKDVFALSDFLLDYKGDKKC
ncbi:HAD-IA family hydrolase [Campylobacter jejuni]|uniref:HAD family hydrolase n=1 Tax=Campylobacter TaxID=194 RepID=UPI00025890E3|nr:MULTISPECIES: HAD-IA family hydrolase [Campylobacter]EAI2862152.1 HAD family hydrolase [Campylobacter jejuni]EAK1144953.1 HAD family hydrolase [Campylobacter jejuni]EAL9887886.1 HAD family hydrolase [Campylobacter jejuni]EBD1689522.1 HAD family hydrolase [Campylobacter jejuni]ECL3067113.1 HAD-IA family hydrolase [Campylobacter jejuni]